MILGIHVTERLQHALPVQHALTEFEGNNKTRLGLHEISDKEAATGRMLLVEFVGSESKFENLTERLNGIEGVKAKPLAFDHQQGTAGYHLSGKNVPVRRRR